MSALFPKVPLGLAFFTLALAACSASPVDQEEAGSASSELTAADLKGLERASKLDLIRRKIIFFPNTASSFARTYAVADAPPSLCQRIETTTGAWTAWWTFGAGVSSTCSFGWASDAGQPEDLARLRAAAGALRVLDGTPCAAVPCAVPAASGEGYSFDRGSWDFGWIVCGEEGCRDGHGGPEGGLMCGACGEPAGIIKDNVAHVTLPTSVDLDRPFVLGKWVPGQGKVAVIKATATTRVVSIPLPAVAQDARTAGPVDVWQVARSSGE